MYSEMSGTKAVRNYLQWPALHSPYNTRSACVYKSVSLKLPPVSEMYHAAAAVTERYVPGRRAQTIIKEGKVFVQKRDGVLVLFLYGFRFRFDRLAGRIYNSYYYECRKRGKM